MPKVKYEGNRRPGDLTTRIVFARDANAEPTTFVDIGGEVDISEEQLQNSQEGFVLTVVGESDEKEPDTAPAITQPTTPVVDLHPPASPESATNVVDNAGDEPAKPSGKGK